MMNDLYRIALSYVGTPHVNGGNIKGVGLDCCTVVTNIYREAGFGTIPVTFGYSGDWYCKRDRQELLLPYLEKHCNRVENLEIGDVISYRFGRSEYAHLSLYLGNNRVIHCSADSGTEIRKLDDFCFFDAKGNSRTSGYWRLKE